MGRPPLLSLPAAFTLVATLLLSPLAAVASAQPTPPVDGIVVDGFRPPAHIGAPGNRGWEYSTTPGTPVRASLGGVVAFAGPVAGNLHVSVDHPGGLRTTYSFLADVVVSVGQTVRIGTTLGHADGRFHFGLRRGATYLDPALLFRRAPAGPPRLVPRPGRVPARVDRSTPSGGASGVIPLHSRLGSNPNQLTFPPLATHGRRVSGAGPGIR